MTRVRLVAYDEGWPSEFQRLGTAIRDALGARVLRIDRLGYERVAPYARDHLPPGGSSDEADWRKAFFLLASPERRVHLHVRVAGAANQRYALLFRDYLRPIRPRWRHTQVSRRSSPSSIRRWSRTTTPT